jgi:hypothetical protein
MRLLNKRNFEKKEPFRSASLFIIICEGEKREPQYFDFFDGLTSKIKVRPIPSTDGKSAPVHLIENAKEAEAKFEVGEDDGIWFILDIDRWRDGIHHLHEECRNRKNWDVAISNPCFEVWLYYHFEQSLPNIQVLDACGTWKGLLPTINNGGFDSSRHPTLLENAIANSKKNFSETGYLPNVGSTQIFRLGERILPFVKNILAETK